LKSESPGVVIGVENAYFLTEQAKLRNLNNGTQRPATHAYLLAIYIPGSTYVPQKTL
jgi:hypothetical protein